MTTFTYTINTDQRRGRPREHAMTNFERQCDQRTKQGLERTKPVIRKPKGLAWFFSPKAVYIDGEWHLDTQPQKFYLLGYAFDNINYGWLYNQNDYTYGNTVKAKPPVKGKNGLSRTSILKLFDGCKTIYFYGPDAGMIETMYHIRLKDRFRCVNLLAVTKRVVPKELLWKATQELQREGVLERGKYSPDKPCTKLCCLEQVLGIRRQTLEYKKDVDNLHRDWYTPHLRAKALLYNKEDVLNLLRAKKLLYSRFNVTPDIEKECTLALTKADINKFKTR